MSTTGKQLKEMAAQKNWQFVKYLPFGDLEDAGQNNFVYKYGVNVPKEPINLNLVNTCCAGGLYFTKLGENEWINDHAYWVSVPDDAQVIYYEKEDKFKTSHLVIEREWTEDEYTIGI